MRKGLFAHKKYVDWCWAFLFIAPTVIGLYLFFLYPMVNSVYMSPQVGNSLSAVEQVINAEIAK